MTKTEVPMTCETPLHLIELLREEARIARYDSANDTGSVRVPVQRLLWLLQDAETLNKLISAAHYQS